ncbi:MAG TPA: hypothetical protein PKJ74_07205 [Chitinophagales bacterium]|nr:hypothetical protein [Chitinophagales bacterium]
MGSVFDPVRAKHRHKEKVNKEYISQVKKALIANQVVVPKTVGGNFSKLFSSAKIRKSM